MLRLLVILLLSLTSLQAELITRAYYVGKDHLKIWTGQEERLLNPGSDSDPFGAPNGNHIAPPSPQKLESRPFDSPHFNDTNDLYDLKIFKKQIGAIDGKLEHAIYNANTGRIIVQGELPAHWFFKALLFRFMDHYEMPGSYPMDLSMEFQKENQVLFATDFRSLSSLETDNQLIRGNDIYWFGGRGYSYHEKNFAQWTISFDGPIDGKTAKIRCTLPMINGAQHTIASSQTGPDEPPVTLSLQSHALVPGEIRVSDLILDRDGKPVSAEERIDTLHPFFTHGISDPTTDKVFKAIRLPGAFLNFVDTMNQRSDAPLIKPYDDLMAPQLRIPSWPTDKLVDVSKFFISEGIDLKPTDFTIMNLNTDTLYCLTDQKSLGQITEYTLAVGQAPDFRVIRSIFQLVESHQQLNNQNVTEIDQKNLVRLALETSPNIYATFFFDSIQLETESSLELDETKLRTGFTLKKVEDDKTIFETKKLLILSNGVPQVVQSNLVNGKWESLIVTSTIRSRADERKAK